MEGREMVKLTRHLTNVRKWQVSLEIVAFSSFAYSLAFFLSAFDQFVLDSIGFLVSTNETILGFRRSISRQ